MTVRIGIVGGGISGLVAAHRLRVELGERAEIIVFDAGKAGGQLRTVDLAGGRSDIGAEAFVARRPEVPALLDELGLGARLVRPGQIDRQRQIPQRVAQLRRSGQQRVGVDGVSFAMSAPGAAVLPSDEADQTADGPRSRRTVLAEVDGNRTRRTGIARPNRFEGGGAHQVPGHLPARTTAVREPGCSSTTAGTRRARADYGRRP